MNAHVKTDLGNFILLLPVSTSSLLFHTNLLKGALKFLGASKSFLQIKKKKYDYKLYLLIFFNVYQYHSNHFEKKKLKHLFTHGAFGNITSEMHQRINVVHQYAQV